MAKRKRAAVNTTEKQGESQRSKAKRKKVPATTTEEQGEEEESTCHYHRVSRRRGREHLSLPQRSKTERKREAVTTTGSKAKRKRAALVVFHLVTLQFNGGGGV
jgi:hypothetical protein